MKLFRFLSLFVGVFFITEIRAQEHQHSAAKKNVFLMMMDTMMIKMDAVLQTGIVERDFVDQMIPHHEGAIAMAKYEVQFGRNPEMIQLAKSILAEQKGEILDMQAMLESYPKKSDSLKNEFSNAMLATMRRMMKNTPYNDKLPPSVDCCFAMVMLPHHTAAVDMAKELIRSNASGAVVVYANRVIGDQQIEIDQMRLYIDKNCKY